MFPDLLWIIGFYAAAAVFAQGLVRRSVRAERRHYVLVAGNHQMQIEWYIRSLRQFARRSGMDIGITVVLDRSNDDTGRIMERFARSQSGIEWVRRSDGGGAAAGRAENGSGARGEVVWVELDREVDVARLPL
ncbi:hypothetical protein ACFPPD_13240 [Cohnella suwonensis]|uniref:Glycosyltransferase 2-like domain-containing protein n=1 Tax=Cohnella suwonensis TaxID=696072 RepID=A0ABW0LWH2_9BACL